MRRIPSEDETFERLGPLKDLWYETLVTALASAHEHFKQHADHRLEKSRFFSIHVREKFELLLREEAEAYNFSVVDMPSGGFVITCGYFVCRFFKAYNGLLPPPNESKALRVFYNLNNGLQPYQPVLPGLEEEQQRCPSATTVHLVLYYDVNAHHELAWLKVACPRYATPSHVECFWEKSIANPLETGRFQIQTATKERKDLSFTKRREDVTEEVG